MGEVVVLIGEAGVDFGIETVEDPIQRFVPAVVHGREAVGEGTTRLNLVVFDSDVDAPRALEAEFLLQCEELDPARIDHSHSLGLVGTRRDGDLAVSDKFIDHLDARSAVGPLRRDGDDLLGLAAAFFSYLFS